MNSKEYETKIQNMAKKFNIKYAKEFFITEKGEVVRMAAIIAQDEYILDELNQQRNTSKTDQEEADHIFKTVMHKEKKQMDTQKTFISVFSISNILGCN